MPSSLCEPLQAAIVAAAPSMSDTAAARISDNSESSDPPAHRVVHVNDSTASAEHEVPGSRWLSSVVQLRTAEPEDGDSKPSPADADDTLHSTATAGAEHSAVGGSRNAAEAATNLLVPAKWRCAGGGFCAWYEKMATNKAVLKVTYTLSVVTVLLVAYSLAVTPWLLPYHFTVSAPALIVQRAVRYSKLKWQPFLVDFCYFGNLGLLVYLWASPGSAEFFGVIFAVVNGPIAIAVVIFRNSLVFHDVDRMTSVFIHVVPMCVTYVIRWYPQLTSVFWYASFSSKLNSGLTNSTISSSSTLSPVVAASATVDMSLVYLIAVPLAWYTLHTLIYGLVEANCIPKDYLTSYRWLTSNEKSLQQKILTIGGRRKTIWIFVMFQWLYGFVGILLARLWYEYFVAHSLFLSFAVLCAVWNGGSYYIEVFGKKSLTT